MFSSLTAEIDLFSFRLIGGVVVGLIAGMLIGALTGWIWGINLGLLWGGVSAAVVGVVAALLPNNIDIVAALSGN